MSKLTKEQRDKLKDEDFVFGAERRYPIHDVSHGVAAIARGDQHGTPEERKKIRSSVCARYPGLKACQTKSYESPLS